MNITFSYDPRKEVDTLRVGFSSQNNQAPTAFAEEAKRDGIDFNDTEQVAAFAVAKMERDGINMTAIARVFSQSWKPVEQEAAARFKRIFQSDWDPGGVMAYLTFSTRCPYNFQKRYFFVSVDSTIKSPVQTSLHELIHFYTHELLEPLFAAFANNTQFNDFKEALSVLLTIEFADLLDQEDTGYPKHRELRQFISREWKYGKDIYEITKEYIKTQ